MIDAQLLIIIWAVAALWYMVHRYKKGIGQQLIVAFLIAFSWVNFFSDYYIYKETNYAILGINLFPLIAWTVGLVFLREIYEKMKSKDRLLKASIIYIIFILFLEYFGYHFLQIQLNFDFPGLFGFNLMHIPLFGKIFYLSAGPIYLWITDYLGVK